MWFTNMELNDILERVDVPSDVKHWLKKQFEINQKGSAVKTSKKESLLENLANNAKYMIYRMSLPDGRYEFLSSASKEIIGYSPEEVYKTPLHIKEIIHPDWNNYFEIQWENLLLGDMPPTYEYQIIDRFGNTKWLNQRNSLVKDEFGKPIAIEGIVSDITEIKKIEKSLIMERDKAQQYLDIARVFILSINSDENVSMINKTGCKLLGEEESNIVGKNWFDNYIPEKTKEKTRIVFQKIVQGEIELQNCLENSIITKNGEERIISWYNACLYDANGAIIGTLSSGVDVTEQKRTNSELKQSLKELSCHQRTTEILSEVEKPIEDTLQKFIDSIPPCLQFPEKVGVKLIFKDKKFTTRNFDEIKGSNWILTNDIKILNEIIGEIQILYQFESFSVESGEDPFLKEERELINTILFRLNKFLEHKKVDEELTKSQMMLELVINTIPHTVFWKDIKSIYQGCNQKFAQEMGCESPHDVINKADHDFNHSKAEVKVFLDSDKHVLENKCPIYHMLIKDERIVENTKYWDTSKVPLYNNRNNLIGILGISEDITKRIENEKLLEMEKISLERSEKKYRRLFNEIPIGLYRTNFEGEILNVNLALLNLFGFDTIEELKKIILTEDNQFDYDRKKFIEKIERDGEIIGLEGFKTRKDGKKIIIRENAKLMYDSLSNTTYYEGSMEDITERVLIEEELRNHYEIEKIVAEISTEFSTSTSNMLKQSMDTVVRKLGESFNLDYSSIKLLSIDNQSIKQTFAWKKEGYNLDISSIQKCYLQLIINQIKHSDYFYVPQVSCLVNESLMQYFYSLEIKSLLVVPIMLEQRLYGFMSLISINNEKIWKEEEISLVGIVSEIISAAYSRRKANKALNKARDALEKKVIEQTSDIKKQKQKIEAILNTISVGILVLDEKNNLMLTNEIVERYYSDLNLGEIPKQVDTFLKSRNHFSDAVNRLLNTEIEKIIAIEPKTDLHLQFSIESNVLSSMKHLGIIIEIRDISRFVAFDNMRKKFVSSVSHELRTPITVINQSITNMVNYKDRLTQDQYSKLVDSIVRNSSLLTELIEDILFVSKIDEDKLKMNWNDYNLIELVINVLAQLEAKIIKKEIEIEFGAKKDIILSGDTKRIEQICRIIIDNAIKFSEEKGKVKINIVDKYTGKYNPSNINGVLIQFIDSGIGISKDEIPNVFDRFFRTKRVVNIEGTGLGLSIAKDLVEFHEGRIYVKSENYKGTKFIIFLPRLNKIRNN